jgi:hypothetical protein
MTDSYLMPTQEAGRNFVMRQNSVDSFLAFESNQNYMKGIRHRTAALEDSRLLPIVEINY